MPLGDDNSMKLTLLCGMGEKCSNKERPGTHQSDDTFADAEACVTGKPRQKRVAQPWDFPEITGK